MTGFATHNEGSPFSVIMLHCHTYCPVAHTLCYLNFYHRLRVAVLAREADVEPEVVAVDDLDVAGLGPAEGVDTPAERHVRVQVHHDARVLAVNVH